MSKHRICAVVLTKNEARNLAACLESLTWTEDLVVVDSGSTDNTREIAQSGRARFFVHEPPTFLIADQRNWALDKVGIQSEWVLFVDADEIIPDSLRHEILRQVAEAPAEVVGFQLCYKLVFMGRWLKHTVGFPAWHDRLLRLGKVRFKGGVWESFDTTGVVWRIREPYLHYAFSNGMDAWIDRHQRYAAWKAQELSQPASQPWHQLADRALSGDKRAFARLAERGLCHCAGISPFLRFFYYYVLRLGFLDGRAGLVYSRMMAAYQFMIYLKMIERQRQAQGLSL